MLDSDLIGFELEALSLLLRLWATPETVKRRSANWEDKIPKLRSAIIAGMGTGVHEMRLPRELVAAEYRNAHRAVKWLKKYCKAEECDARRLQRSLVAIRVPHEVEGLRFERPAPIPHNCVKDICPKLAGKGSTPSEVSYWLVGQRLVAGTKKVKIAAAKATPKRHRLSETQQLLIGVFLDLCSSARSDQVYGVLAKILNTLFRTQCHILVVYYLLQKAHTVVGKELFQGEYDLEKVRELCDMVCAERNLPEFQPFLRLIGE